MRKLTILLVMALGLVVVGCEESYEPIPSSNPPQVVVQDANGDIDDSNVDVACAEAYGPKYSLKSVSYVQGEHKFAVVTCGESK